MRSRLSSTLLACITQQLVDVVLRLGGQVGEVLLRVEILRVGERLLVDAGGDLRHEAEVRFAQRLVRVRSDVLAQSHIDDGLHRVLLPRLEENLAREVVLLDELEERVLIQWNSPLLVKGL